MEHLEQHSISKRVEQAYQKCIIELEQRLDKTSKLIDECYLKAHDLEQEKTRLMGRGIIAKLRDLFNKGLKVKLARMSMEIAESKRLLLKYGSHQSGCDMNKPVNTYKPRKCDCGLDKAKRGG